MAEPVRVLFALHSLEVGGLETYLLRFLQHVGSRVQATVLCKSGRAGPMCPAFEAAGAHVRTLNLGTWPTLRYAQLWSYIRHETFDAICDLTGDFGALALTCARLAGIKCRVAFYRGSAPQFAASPLRTALAGWYNRQVARAATSVLANSRIGLSTFHAALADQVDKAAVIRNPAPKAPVLTKCDRAALRQRLDVGPDMKLITHVGSVRAAKNHETFFATAKRLLSLRSDLVFLCCGRGLTAQFGALIEDPALGPHLRIFEYRDDIADLLQASDLFLFPSLNEGMPNALLEAMAVGCPIAASDIPAIAEIVPPSWRQQLFAPTDADAACTAVLRVLSQPRECHGQALSHWAHTHFSAQCTLDSFLHVLETGGVPR